MKLTFFTSEDQHNLELQMNQELKQMRLRKDSTSIGITFFF